MTLSRDLDAQGGLESISTAERVASLTTIGTPHWGTSFADWGITSEKLLLAILSTLRKSIGSTTLEFKISFVRPITPDIGLITAVGTVINCGRRVGTAEGRVTDGKGRLFVHGTTTCLIFEH